MSDKRSDWLIGGASSGAYCAIRSALVHSEVWGSVIAFSGYDYPLVGPLGPDRRTGEANMLSHLAGLPRAYPVSMYLSGTRSDPDSTNVSTKMAKAGLGPYDSLHVHIAKSGGHNWHQWRKELPLAMKWWGQRLRSPHHEVRTAPHITGHYDTVSRYQTRKDPFSTWSLMGMGWIVLTGLGACCLWGIATARGGRIAALRCASAWKYMLGLFMVVVCVVAMALPLVLLINRLGEFYVAIPELLADL